MVYKLEDASKIALSLSTKDRASLVHALLQSLDEQVDEDVEQAWDDEIAKRIERFEAGESKDHDAFAVLDEIRANYQKWEKYA